MSDEEPVGTAAADRSADEAAIRALLNRQISSWDAGDPVAYASAYTRNGDCVSFLGGHYQGRDAIAASCEVPRAGSVVQAPAQGSAPEASDHRSTFRDTGCGGCPRPLRCDAWRATPRPQRQGKHERRRPHGSTAGSWPRRKTRPGSPLVERLTSKAVSRR